MIQDMLQGRPKIGVFLGVGGAPGLCCFAIPRFSTFPKVGLKSLRGLLAAAPGGLAEEGGADIDHDDAALFPNRPEQIVVRIAQEARNEVPRAGMGGNDRYGGKLEDLVGRFIRYVGEIEHDACVIECRHEGLPEGG